MMKNVGMAFALLFALQGGAEAKDGKEKPEAAFRERVAECVSDTKACADYGKAAARELLDVEKRGCVSANLRRVLRTLATGTRLSKKDKHELVAELDALATVPGCSEHQEARRKSP
jgi:hypothetical protein